MFWLVVSVVVIAPLFLVTEEGRRQAKLPISIRSVRGGEGERARGEDVFPVTSLLQVMPLCS